VGNAYGAKKYKVAGQYFQIAFYVAFWILIPVIFLWSITGPVLKYLGNDSEISNASWSYALILMCALPGRITFRNIAAYFGAMKILKPSVRSSIIGVTVNLVIGLPLVTGWPFSLKEDGF
jgi:Na+-driven multidrug efflux pump